jgi:ArsR family transcriptional regulator, arsenate/arsenite/antimonite-responsive transcriptional repressor
MMIDRVSELASILKVLSDPTRLRILSLLLVRTHCNCEISASLDLSLSLVSHHMRILRLVGLVNGVRHPKDERWVYYSVNRSAVQHLETALQAILHPAEVNPPADIASGCCVATKTQASGD